MIAKKNSRKIISSATRCSHWIQKVDANGIFYYFYKEFYTVKNSDWYLSVQPWTLWANCCCFLQLFNVISRYFPWKIHFSLKFFVVFPIYSGRKVTFSKTFFYLFYTLYRKWFFSWHFLMFSCEKSILPWYFQGFSKSFVKNQFLPWSFQVLPIFFVKTPFFVGVSRFYCISHEKSRFSWLFHDFSWKISLFLGLLDISLYIVWQINFSRDCPRFLYIYQEKSTFPCNFQGFSHFLWKTTLFPDFSSIFFLWDVDFQF